MEKINKIFIIQVTLFVFSIFIVSVVGFFLLTKESVDTEIISEFEYELAFIAGNLNFKILMAEENVKAISSRTMIRNELFNWHKKKIALEQLKAFTQPKYSDGASVYRELLYSIRTDTLGNKIADYQMVAPGDELNAKSPLSFFLSDKGSNVLIRNEIIQAGILIGFDTAAFWLSDFKNQDSQLLEQIRINEQEFNNPVISQFSASVPIGETGYYLYAELKQGALKAAARKTILPVLFEAILLITVVFFISYFTIFKLTYRLIKKLNLAQDKAIQQERFAAVGQISAGIAHDFNNLLMGILGYTELIQHSRETPPSIQPLLEKVAASGRQAAHLVVQLLDFSRKSIRRVESLDLMKFIRQSISLLEPVVLENIKLSVKGRESRCFIEADPSQISKILMNLILNAKEAGGTEVTIEILKVYKTVSSLCTTCGEFFCGEWISFAVIDNGKGIPEEVLPHIFEPFYTTKEVGKGSGLGLAQVYGIVKEHQGHVFIENHTGNGTAFLFYFPPSSFNEKTRTECVGAESSRVV